MPPPPPGAASSLAVVGSTAALHSTARPGGPPPPPPTLAQLQRQQQQQHQRPPYARHPATATGINAQVYHPPPNVPFVAAQRPFVHPPASKQIVDALCDKLLQDPHFYQSVMDIACRRGFSLHAPAVPTSSSAPVASDPSPDAITEKHASATTKASTVATEAVQECPAHKESSTKHTLSKGRQKRLRNVKRTMEKRTQSYLNLLSQSMIRTKIKDLEAVGKTRLSKVNRMTSVDLTPERARMCRRKLQSGCKADPEFINVVTKELDRMVKSTKEDGSMDSKERRRKAKAFRNLAGYHDLIVKSLKADLQPSEEADRTESVAATAPKQ
ncbi:hypothetical protein EC968_000305 [Mortierella alpina]|nr:hypothetical protein EC968_000305 [Mortierella alpina]